MNTINKKCGIICEYNPLHNGHVRQIENAKKSTGCDTLICVMSGNFTQRGDGAVLNKFERAKHAVKAGADIVLELPTVFASNSAEDFSFGAIKILNALSCDFLHFGSESGQLEDLQKLAEFQLSPPVAYELKLKENLKEGLSYPHSVSRAMDGYFGQELLSRPNNTLAIEYLKALKQSKSKIQPYTMQRNSDYNSDELFSEFCSASAIRKVLNSDDFNSIEKHVPQFVFDDLKQECIFNQTNFEIFAHSFLVTVSPVVLKEIYGMEEGLNNKLYKSATLATFHDMLFATKSKRYTLLKIKRLILNSVLGVTKSTIKKAKKMKPYFRVLAINKDRCDILSDFSMMSGISNVENLNESQKEIFAFDVKATNLYNSLCGRKGNSDFTNPLQKVDI